MFDPKLASIGIPLFLGKSVDALHQKQSRPGIRQLLHPLHLAPTLWPLYPGIYRMIQHHNNLLENMKCITIFRILSF